MSDAKLTATMTCDASQALTEFKKYQKGFDEVIVVNKKATTSLKSTGQAVTDFSRVIQDAPFGFVAIQNNINPLIESFGRLKAEAASTGTSLLKTLGGALTGPAGIGLAVAAASSAITLFTNGLGAWTRGFGSAKDAADGATKAAEKWAQGLSSINAEIGKEATQVGIIVGLLDKGNLSRNEQVSAIEKLIKISPDYFGGLNKEKASLDQINTAYTTYLANLDKEFQAKAIELKLQELYNQKLDIEGNKKLYGDLTQQIKDLNKELAARPTKNIGGVDVVDLARISELNAKLKTLKEQSGQAFKTAFGSNILNANDNLKDINAQIDALMKKRVELGNLGIVPPIKEKDKKEIDVLAERIKALQELLSKGLLGIQGRDELIDLRAQIIVRDQNKNHFTDAEVQKLIGDLDNEINSKLKGKEINLKSMGVNFEPDTIDTSKALKGIKSGSVFTVPVDVDLKLKFENAQKALADLNRQIEDSIGNLVSDLANNLGDAIGGIVTGKGLKDAFENFGQTIGAFMKQVGQAFIKFAVQMIVIDKAINSLKPELALIAGVAMVAIGSAIQQSIVKQTPFAKGGIVTGPTNALIGEAGPEVVFPLNQLNRFIRTNMTQAPQRIQVEGVISGNNILLANRRAQKNQNLYTR